MASAFADDDLWRRASGLITSSSGWSLRPLRRLGRSHDLRRTWLAEGEPGLVVVKANANPFVGERMTWAPMALAALRARGYPVPTILWQGVAEERWSLVVLEHLPGAPLRTLDDSALDAVLALVELQADLTVGPGGWNTPEWIELVLFEGWAGWWDTARAAAPRTSRRLQAFLQPAHGLRLPNNDLVHGDLNLSNILTSEGRITGVVDWDAIGHGSRATDLAGPLFDWHRIRRAGGNVTAAGHLRIVRRVVEIAGDEGLRCAITYAAIARLALTAERRDDAELEEWRDATDGILDALT
jgi:aminoglycoside phosphotransferase (APT) family kinase protein